MSFLFDGLFTCFDQVMTETGRSLTSKDLIIGHDTLSCPLTLRRHHVEDL